MKSVRIVGAGFSGLTLAYHLQKRGFQVEVFEKEQAPGGLLKSERTPFMLSEASANGFVWSPSLEEMFSDLQVETVFPLKKSRRRYIYRDGFKRWPLDLQESLFLARRFTKRILFSSESRKPKPMESLADWGYRCLGSSATEYILKPAMLGIYAASPEDLSATLVLRGLGLFQKNKIKLKKIKRGLIAPRDGMEHLIHSLRHYLISNGATIHTGRSFSDLSSKSAAPVCWAVNFSEHLKLQQVDPSCKLETVPLVKVNLSFDIPQAKLDGFGVLISRDQGFKTLGVLANTNIFDHRGPCYNESWILGGKEQRELLHLSDSDILDLVADERIRLLKTKENWSESQIFRWPEALPLYSVHLEKYLHLFKAKTEPLQYFTGNFWGAIGLTRIFDYNQSLAEKVAEEWKGP